MTKQRSGLLRTVRWATAGGLLGAGWVAAKKFAPQVHDQVLATAAAAGDVASREVSSHLVEAVVLVGVLVLDRLGRRLGLESKSFFHLVLQLGGILLRSAGWAWDVVRGRPRRPVSPRAVQLVAEGEAERLAGLRQRGDGLEGECAGLRARVADLERENARLSAGLVQPVLETPTRQIVLAQTEQIESLKKIVERLADPGAASREAEEKFRAAAREALEEANRAVDKLRQLAGTAAAESPPTETPATS